MTAHFLRPGVAGKPVPRSQPGVAVRDMGRQRQVAEGLGAMCCAPPMAWLRYTGSWMRRRITGGVPRVGGPRKDAPLPAGRCRCKACPALDGRPCPGLCPGQGLPRARSRRLQEHTSGRSGRIAEPSCGPAGPNPGLPGRMRQRPPPPSVRPGPVGRSPGDRSAHWGVIFRFRQVPAGGRWQKPADPAGPGVPPAPVSRGVRPAREPVCPASAAIATRYGRRAHAFHDTTAAAAIRLRFRA